MNSNCTGQQTNRMRSGAWAMSVVLMASGLAWAANVGKTFTYQGQLTQNGIPVNDDCDFVFSLWDADNAGNQVGANLPLNLVNVNNGRFAVPLDFGDAFRGEARWLEIAVDCPSGNNNFVTLNPRQELTPTPYAIGLSLPFTGEVDDIGNAVEVINTGLGRAGSFQNSSPMNTEAALNAVTVGSGPAGAFLNDGGGFAISATTTSGSTAIFGSSSGTGIEGEGTGPNGVGVHGVHNGGGTTAGVLGETSSATDNAVAVHGRVTAAGGGNMTAAVRGENQSNDPGSIGVWGSVPDDGWGVFGEAPGDSGYGVYGKSLEGIGVRGEHTSFAGSAPAIFGLTTSGGVDTTGVRGSAPADTTNPTYGVRGDSNSSSGAGVFGEGTTGVLGQGTGDAGGTGGPGGPDGNGGTGVHGIGTTGVRGDSANDNGTGVYGFAEGLNGVGVRAEAFLNAKFGLEALNNSGTALRAVGSGVGIEVEGNSAGVTASAFNNDAPAVSGYSAAGPGIVGDSNSPLHAGGYFRNQAGGPALHADGLARVGILEITGADLAERFPFSEPVKPGMVVAIDPDNPGHLCVSRETHNKRVVGIVTGANDFSVGIVLGNLPGSEDHEAVALNGRVWVYCDAPERPVEVGDLLTTAARPGYAMPVADPDRAQGATIGKAMTALPQGESGMVLVFVNLQ